MRQSKNQRLINNARLKKNAELRANVLGLIRAFFEDKGFLEVDTPLLDFCPSMEPAIHSFESTFLNGENEYKLYLQSSPEYNMKKLLVSGYDKIYQITKSFRNNELTRLHNPEFTILEWYRAGSDYNKIMQDVEELTASIYDDIKSQCSPEFLNKRVDFSCPYDRISVKEAFKRYSGIDLDELTNEDYYIILRNKGLKIVEREVDFNTFFYFIFINEIEPHLGEKRPVFLVDFPKQLGSLARKKEDDSDYVERFELYIRGLELCNAFSELNDFKEQRDRFLDEKKKRADDKLADYPLDDDFLYFLQRGMPAAAGIAMGIDRLLMLFSGANNITDVILFPFLMMNDFKENA